MAARTRDRAKSGSGADGGGGRLGGVPPWLAAHGATVARWSLLVVLLIGVTLGWWWLRGTLLSRETRSAGVLGIEAVDNGLVRFVEPPAWLPESARLSVESTLAAAMAAGRARAEAGSADEAGDGHEAGGVVTMGLDELVVVLNDSAWVREVEQLWRGSDGGLYLKAAYRRPFAMVQWGRGCYLVDEQRVVLDGPFDDRQVAAYGLPVMINPDRGVPRHWGDVWEDAGLAAGLSVAGLLEATPVGAQVAAYDVSGRDRSNRVQVVLRVKDRRGVRGGSVVWGLPPGQGPPIEPDYQEKLRRLEQIASMPASQGWIDAHGRRVFINGATIATADESRP